jgi:hypothetical protein
VRAREFKKLSVAIVAGLTVLLILLCTQSFAQGLGGLSQLLGGSSHSRGSSHSGSAVSVERNAAPYLGKFDGKQNEGSGTRLNTEFACYPAHDAALPQSNTFVCYTPETANGGTE